MIKHFCDRCERPLGPQDFDPFIRVDVEKRIIVSVMAMDENQKPITDLCNLCKNQILRDGVPTKTVAIPHMTTVQEASPLPIEEVATSQPEPTTHIFEPSMPVGVGGTKPALLPKEPPSPMPGERPSPRVG